MKQTFSVVLRSLAAAALAAGVWIAAAPHVQAKAGGGGSLTITPLGTLRAGPDFATDILGDPWDFSNREDVTPDPAQIDGFSLPNGNDGFSGFTVANGKAGGTITLRRDGNPGGSFFHILSRAWNGILNPGRTGRNHPIDPTVYSQMSFKANYGGNSNQLPRIGWYHGDIADPAGDGYGERAVDDFTVGGINPALPGDGIYVVDLTAPGGNNSGAAWTSGLIKGLLIWPNSQADTNYQVQFDWVRLTTKSTHVAATNKTITWSPTNGTATIKVTDAAGTIFTVATNVSSGYNWNYGVLPPGSYTMTITDSLNSGTTSFTINTPPLIKITDPDDTGGQDFATAVLGNAWDMNSLSDINEDPCCIRDHLVSPQTAGGVLNATSDGVTVGFAGAVPVGDPQVYLLSNPRTSNTTDIIDTTKYHRLTFDLQVDRAFDLGRGSVARVFWGSDSNDTAPGGTPYNVTTTKDIITWPGKNVYTLDLATLTTEPNQGGLESGNATPWTTKPVRHFRIDPFEFAEQLGFHIDNVKLAADDETANGAFTIKWLASDPDAGQSPLVSLFYDSDTNPVNGMTAIASNIAMAAGQYVWNTGSVTPGTYYIYAAINDGINSSTQYSSGPVRVVSFTPPSNVVMNIDSPADGGTVTAAFEVAGWAIDTAAASDTGVDSMQYWMYPNDGAGPGVFLGTGSYGGARADVGAVFGTRFTNSAFHFTATGMTPGQYVLGVFAHSTVSNTFTPKLIHITVSATTLMSIDVPAPESTIASQTFAVAGWAIDRTVTDGSVGVDAVHVYAYPDPTNPVPPAPIFLGVATLGFDRPDVAAFYGSQFENAGYILNIDRAVAGLTPGLYNIAIWAHSTATGSFNNVAVVRVTLQ